MLPMNQLPMLSQDEYNDFIEFQNFKKLKYAQQQLKAGIPPSGLNLSAAANSSAAAAAAFNFFNNPNGNSAMNSIFPMTSSASIPTTSMSMSMLAANQSFLNHHQHQQQQQQQSQQIIPKVVPNGIPLQLMRQPSAASFMPYKNVPNFPGLKGGASNFTPSPNMFATMPPSMPIQTLTPKVATPNTNTPQQQQLTPTTPQAITMISPPPPATTTLISPQIHKRRAPSPEIIVDDRPEADMQINCEKKAKLQKIMPESYTTKTDSCFPKLSLQSATSNTSYQHITSSSISSLPSIDNSLKITPSSTISLPSTTSPSTSSISSTSTTTVSRDIISPPLQSSNTKPTTSLSTPIPTPLFPQPHSHSIPAASESFMDAEETHIIITARPRVPDSAEREETYTTEDDSDYDTNLRPKETPLQYKERMMVRVMDKAKRKNEASKRSREKRKREHQDRQMEKQRLERRNMELTEKLMNLKEALKRLRPQICISCNEQVQKFLDQCQNSKEGMNVFVLRPCKQDKCPGNKSVGREIGKFARGQ